ncbi:fruit protein [Seminavis robusta]|uniref:Fruit protein n=1 Tax=Seminavis robusta TaxID=568900 RepID=A0A9N8DS57_9STRA|nr:fruit protein [Seminavis robusta]|eukprot:Sro249_g098710.1 fruit protein (307) ;mRNA; f:47042-47962
MYWRVQEFVFLFSLSAAVCLALRPNRHCSSCRPTLSKSHLALAADDSNWWEPTWTDVEIISNEAVSASARAIRVSITDELRDSYRAPGQYIQVKQANADDDDNPNMCFLPLASAPRNDYFEFLVKTNRDDRSWMLEPGVTKLQLSGVLGKGFQPREIDETIMSNGERPNIFGASTIIMAANGSGMASLKAAIESGRLTSGGTLYYGERTKEDLCYKDLYSEWKSKFGFQVVPCLSQPTKDDDLEDSVTPIKEGYVQDVVSSNGLEEHDPATCFALLCGVMEMMDGVTEFLKGEGVSVNTILLNLEG